MESSLQISVLIVEAEDFSHMNTNTICSAERQPHVKRVNSATIETFITHPDKEIKYKLFKRALINTKNVIYLCFDVNNVFFFPRSQFTSSLSP